MFTIASSGSTVDASLYDGGDGSGGVLVKPSTSSAGSTITLYDNVEKLYSLDSPVLISRNTRLQFAVENVDNAKGVYVCFYQRVTDFIQSDLRCLSPDFNQPNQDILGK